MFLHPSYPTIMIDQNGAILYSMLQLVVNYGLLSVLSNSSTATSRLKNKHRCKVGNTFRHIYLKWPYGGPCQSHTQCYSWINSWMVSSSYQLQSTKNVHSSVRAIGVEKRSKKTLSFSLRIITHWPWVPYDSKKKRNGKYDTFVLVRIYVL